MNGVVGAATGPCPWVDVGSYISQPKCCLWEWEDTHGRRLLCAALPGTVFLFRLASCGVFDEEVALLAEGQMVELCKFL